MKSITGNDVIAAILQAKTSNLPGDKARATRCLNKYVAQRVKDGFDYKMVEAGIKAAVSRILNQKYASRLKTG
jgi:hypothetical protein